MVHGSHTARTPPGPQDGSREGCARAVGGRRGPLARPLRRGRRAAAAATLLLAGLGACDGPTTPPAATRFAQLGSIDLRLEVPRALGEGQLLQEIHWLSSGAWVLRESISYRGLLGDETVVRSFGDPGPSAAAYASVIARVNGVAELSLFVPDLSPDVDPTCGPTLTRLTLTLRDDLRKEEESWTRCVNGSLDNLTTFGAGPDAAAGRVAQAALFVREGTALPGYDYAYTGSLPFGTLDRGEDTDSPLRASTAFTEEEDYLDFWAAHAPGRSAPEVDFTEQMVLVALVGEREEAGDSVEIRKVLQVGEGTLTEVWELVPGDFCSPAARTHVPFHVAVAPRSPEPLRFSATRRLEVPCG